MRQLALLVATAGLSSAVPGFPPPRTITRAPVNTPVGGPCDDFCCHQTTRPPCCGPDHTDNSAGACDFGPQSGYCVWTGNNVCERNLYNRSGDCAEVEFLFNVTLAAADANNAALNALALQIAKEANLMIGSLPNTVQPVRVTYEADIPLLTVVVRCPDGGCGTLEYIADSLCPAGVEVTNTGGQVVYKGNPLCLAAAPGGGLSEEFPLDDIAGLNPLRVTARVCEDCVPELGETTTIVVNDGVPLAVNIPIVFTREVVNGNSITPAFIDSPPLNTFCNVPQEYQGLYHFRMNYTAVLGTKFTVICPPQCLSCRVFVIHYHDPPCSSEFNGNFPELLPADGWTPTSCAPCLTGDGNRYPMVGYYKVIPGNTSVTTPAVATNCLKYFAIFAGPGADCESNELQDELLCNQAGGLCVFENGECKTSLCPRIPGEPNLPKVCTPAPGLTECPLSLTDDEIAAALEQFGLN